MSRRSQVRARLTMLLGNNLLDFTLCRNTVLVVQYGYDAASLAVVTVRWSRGSLVTFSPRYQVQLDGPMVPRRLLKHFLSDPNAEPAIRRLAPDMLDPVVGNKQTIRFCSPVVITRPDGQAVRERTFTVLQEKALVLFHSPKTGIIEIPTYKRRKYTIIETPVQAELPAPEPEASVFTRPPH